jgi:hypothetical protein
VGVLCAATVALCILTAMLAQATWAEKEHHEPAQTEEVATERR